MLIVASVTFPRNRNRSKKRITRTIMSRLLDAEPLRFYAAPAQELLNKL
jgi:hypothetical protein